MLVSTLISLLPLLASLPSGQAANADQWRSRSIYQLLTDRFAPATDNNAPCNTDDRRYCGGTWQSIISKLDYIQGMGYDAVWISPTGQNIESTTVYGEAYHAYWITDPTKPNPHFGTSDDLKALSKALHDRGMYLMADIAINSLTSLTNDLSDSSLANAAGGQLLFKKGQNYHTPCNMNYGNHNSEVNCWLRNSDVYLMDLNQDDPEVVSTISNWIKSYVQEYGIDGLRMDATKHMEKKYQNAFCKDAGVFCIGEVYGDDVTLAASYTGPDGLDAVFGFGMYYGFLNSFTGGSPKPMSDLANRLGRATAYADPSVIGSFLENHDVSRFNSLESDKSRVYNAITGAFLYGGIPAMYYGLEQDIADGHDDPHNREALWLYNGYSTTGDTYNRIKSLNNIRQLLGKNATWLKAIAKSVATQYTDIAMSREGILIVLTNRGSSGAGTWKIDNTGFKGGASIVDLLTCTTTLTPDSNGAVTVTWTSGQPFVLAETTTAASNGLCTAASTNPTSSESLVSIAPQSSSSGSETTDSSNTSTSTESSPSAPVSSSTSTNTEATLTPASSTTTAPPDSSTGSSNIITEDPSSTNGDDETQVVGEDTTTGSEAPSTSGGIGGQTGGAEHSVRRGRMRDVALEALLVGGITAFMI